MLGDPQAEVPTEFNGRAVATARDVVTLSVRHAQDIEADTFEGDSDWATATIHLRSLVAVEATGRHVLCDTVIATPRETVAVGGADGNVGHFCTKRANPPDRRYRRSRPRHLGDSLG